MREGIFSLRRVKAIMVKEFTQLRRDRATFAMILMVPIMQLTLFGFAINSDPKYLPAAVLAEDHGQFARAFEAGLKNSEYFAITREPASENEATRLLKIGEVQFVVTIPQNFERDLVRGTHPSIVVEADATDPIATAGALGAVPGILARILDHELTGPLAYLRGKPDAVELRLQRRYNPE